MWGVLGIYNLTKYRISYNALQKKLFAFHHASPSEYVLRLRITSQLLENSKFETFGQDF